MMKYLIPFCLFIIFMSCREVQSEDVIVQIQKASKENAFFPNFYSKDTLSLKVGIDDCGEWGGPEDEFIIYMDSLRQYRLSFKRYKMDCDSIWKYYGRSKPLEVQKKLLLNDASKKVISDFLKALMAAKINERADSNGGSSYCLSNSDSTLFVKIHSTEREIEEDFYKFKRDLGFPESRKKEEDIPIDSRW